KADGKLTASDFGARTGSKLLAKSDGAVEGRYELSIPPAAALTPFVRCREPIAVVLRSQIARRSRRKRIGAQQPERLRVAAQDAGEQIEKPSALWPRRHRFKPHQPVEPHVIRRDLRRQT